MLKGSFEFEVLVHGSPVREYRKDGSTYIEAREGTSFSLRMRNNSGDRVLFVPTVDGLSIMNGEEGSYNSNGYIIRPYSSTTIDGWRRSDREVAEFYFSKPNDSYRKRSGKGVNLGSIGAAVFRERRKEVLNPYQKPVDDEIEGYPKYPKKYPRRLPWIYPGYPIEKIYEFMDAGSTAGDMTVKNTVMYCGNDTRVMMNSVSQDLGTGWGSTKKSEVTTVAFEKESSPSEVFVVYYNTHERLEELGVQFKEPLYTNAQAFPGEWCKPPKN